MRKEDRRIETMLDLVERVIVLTLFVAFARFAALRWQPDGGVILILLALSEAIPVAFILMRKFSGELSLRPTDWLIGVAGTIAPLLVRPSGGHGAVPQIVCVAILLIGILLQLSAKLVLGERFGIIAANRGIRTIGPYRIIRHPMYAGYSLTHFAILLAMPGWRTGLLYALAFSLQLWRIAREERLLTKDPAYLALKRRVPYRLCPGIF